jgi:hypothetical protein
MAKLTLDSVVYYIDPELVHHTHAIKDILPGDELTINYVDPYRARTVRQDRTVRSWGFKCTCPQCSLSDYDAGLSDQRLVELWRIENILEDFQSENSTPEMVERMLHLYEEEHLDAEAARAHMLAAVNYNLFGNEEKAVEHAMIAVETGELRYGIHAGDVKSMRELMKDHKGHWSWNKGH